MVHRGKQKVACCCCGISWPDAMAMNEFSLPREEDSCPVPDDPVLTKLGVAAAVAGILWPAPAPVPPPL